MATPVNTTNNGVDDIFVVSSDVLILESLAKQVAHDSAGAIVTFSGTTRNTFEGNSYRYNCL
jgi:molybdopterin synthase catalytic subunit